MTLRPLPTPPWTVAAVLAMTLWACGCRERGDDRASLARAGGETGSVLAIAAAASLAEVARDLAAGWEERTGAEVVVRLAGSSTLARQIRAGAAADLFLSASAEWVDGLDVLARRPWLGNRLAVVVLAGSLPPTGDVAGFLAGEDGLVLAEPGVPVGRAAEAALASLGVALPSRVVRGAHARDVLSKVSQGAARAGIVYLTDAALDDEVEVLAVLPEACHPAIRYEAALLNPAARALFDALGEPWVLDAAARRGFRVDGHAETETDP